MSFDEFLNHPRSEIENFINIINELDKKKSQVNEDFLSEIQKSTTSTSNK